MIGFIKYYLIISKYFCYSPCIDLSSLSLDSCNFSKHAKDYPTVIRTKRTLILTSKETSKQYELEADALFRVVDKNSHDYVIEAQSNKQELVRLNVSKKDATPMEDGLWKLVTDKKEQTGWLKIEK